MRVDQAVTDLTSTGVGADRNRVLAEALAQLGRMLEQFATQGFAPLRKEWDSYHVYAAKPVALRMPDGSFEHGSVAGVSDDGALLLQTSSGLRRFHSGEVSLRPLGEPRFASGG